MEIFNEAINNIRSDDQFNIGQIEDAPFSSPQYLNKGQIFFRPTKYTALNKA